MKNRKNHFREQIDKYARRGDLLAVNYYREKMEQDARWCLDWPTFRSTYAGREWMRAELRPFLDKFSPGLDAEYYLHRAFKRQMDLILDYGVAAFEMEPYALLEITIRLLEDAIYLGEPC